MNRDYEAWSPVDVERRLIECVNQLTKAQNALKEARDKETNAEIAYKSAYRRAMLSKDCPKVTRGGYTTSERDAWVEEQCDQPWQDYRFAKTTRESAEDHLRIQRDIGNVVQSIGALVRTAYSMAGVAA